MRKCVTVITFEARGHETDRRKTIIKSNSINTGGVLVVVVVVVVV